MQLWCVGSEFIAEQKSEHTPWTIDLHIFDKLPIRNDEHFISGITPSKTGTGELFQASSYPWRVFFTLSPRLSCEAMALFPQEEEVDSPFSLEEGGRRRWRSQVANEEKRCIVNSRGIISSTAMAIMKEATMTVMAEPVVMAAESEGEWARSLEQLLKLSRASLALMNPQSSPVNVGLKEAVGRTQWPAVQKFDSWRY